MPVYDAFISYSHARDKPIAAALQSVIQKLGKPWYRRRSLRVFRDDTSLSATPQLWPSIEQALSQSRFLLLLSSLEAAGSHWVGKEVEYWLANKSTDTLLIGVTDGRLTWNEAQGDFDWTKATPLPPMLKGRFSAEPKWVDLSAYREGANPRNSRFIELGADFAAAIHGMPKEDLLSQEVRQQRRARRLAVGAATSLLVLAGAALWQWDEAVRQRATAIQQRDSALVAQSRLLAKASQDALGTGSASKATLLALEALPGKGPEEFRPYVVDAERALRASLAAPQEIFRISAALGSDEKANIENAIAIGDNDIFVAEEHGILHYQMASRKITHNPLDDQPIALHLSGSNHLFIGTKSRRVLTSGPDAKGRTVLAELPYEITNISSSADDSFVLVAGEATWSLLDPNTGKITKASSGLTPIITQQGKVIYDKDGSSPGEVRMFDPSSNQDTILFRDTREDAGIIDFAMSKGGDVLDILTTEEIVSLDLSTRKKKTLELSILSTQWQDMVVADSGMAAVICAFRSPICVVYDFDADDALPLYHSENADSVSFGASASEFMTFTDDGRLYAWDVNSRGAHDFALREPEFKLELLGSERVRTRLLADPNSFVTVASRGKDIVVQGWKKRITRLRTPVLNSFHPYILIGKAEDKNLWLLPGISTDSYLYDFGRDELITVPFDNNKQRLVRLCGSPRLMLVRSESGLEMWDASGSTVRKIAIPDQLAPFLSDRERPADLICKQQTLAIAAGDKVLFWNTASGITTAPSLAGEVKGLLALEANGTLMVLEFDKLHVLSARGEELASARRELVARGGETFFPGAACVAKDRGALLMLPADREEGSAFVYRFEIAGNEIRFLAENEFDSSVYRFAFNKGCTLLAYHPNRSGKANVFDLEKGQPIAEFRLGESEYYGIDFAANSKGLLLFSGTGQIYLANFDEDLIRSTDYARETVISCLSPEERAYFSLTPEPPPWCITGSGRETESDPSRWVPKPPYDSDAWRTWFTALRIAREKGDNPPPAPR